MSVSYFMFVHPNICIYLYTYVFSFKISNKIIKRQTFLVKNIYFNFTVYVKQK